MQPGQNLNKFDILYIILYYLVMNLRKSLQSLLILSHFGGKRVIYKYMQRLKIYAPARLNFL